MKLHCFSELFTVSESSLQIPVNSQALTLENAQRLSHFLEYLSPQIISENNIFAYDDIVFTF